MGTEILTDGDFSAIASAIILPVPGVINWHTFGGTASAGRANLADPAAPLVAVGAPVIADSYAALDSGTPNNYETGRSEAASLTMFAVARASADATGNPRIASNGDGTNSGFSFFLNTTSSKLQMQLLFSDAPTTLRLAEIVLPNLTDWRLYMARVTEGAGYELRNLTQGQVSTQGRVAARTLAPRTLRVGGRPVAASGGQIDLAHFSYAPFAMTEEQIIAHAAFIRSEMLFQASPITV